MYATTYITDLNPVVVVLVANFILVLVKNVTELHYLFGALALFALILACMIICCCLRKNSKRKAAKTLQNRYTCEETFLKDLYYFIL